jgi:hypothetical protein
VHGLEEAYCLVWGVFSRWAILWQWHLLLECSIIADVIAFCSSCGWVRGSMTSVELC